MIGTERRPEEAAGMAPGIEHNSFFKPLAFRGHHYAIVFAPRARSRYALMQLECAKWKLI